MGEAPGRGDGQVRLPGLPKGETDGIDARVSKITHPIEQFAAVQLLHRYFSFCELQY
jgi:hypothetical protein